MRWSNRLPDDSNDAPLWVYGRSATPPRICRNNHAGPGLSRYVTYSPWTHSHTTPTILPWAIGRLPILGFFLGFVCGNCACPAVFHRRNLPMRLTLTERM